MHLITFIVTSWGACMHNVQTTAEGFQVHVSKIQ